MPGPAIGRARCEAAEQGGGATIGDESGDDVGRAETAEHAAEGKPRRPPDRHDGRRRVRLQVPQHVDVTAHGEHEVRIAGWDGAVQPDDELGDAGGRIRRPNGQHHAARHRWHLGAHHPLPAYGVRRVDQGYVDGTAGPQRGRPGGPHHPSGDDEAEVTGA